MSTRFRHLSQEEITRTFSGAAGKSFPEILSPQQFAGLLGISLKTVYEWISRGRLDGAFRKRGKHILIWRDRALKILFNGPDWRTDHDQ